MLDTPGGMKIQTIHSFCQDILKRFPLEAGISPYFEVLDDRSAKEILQNIKCILSTVKFSVPLDRDFGIDASMVDMPMDVAKAQLASEIIMAVAKYEPRAAVTNIDWEHDIDGILKPKVQVRIDET